MAGILKKVFKVRQPKYFYPSPGNRKKHTLVCP